VFRPALANYCNVGTGSDVTLRELSSIVARAVGYGGEVLWDTSMPDGTPRKLLDVSVIESTGWKPMITLEDGIASTVGWYREHIADARE